jgi:hypothetical protein
MNSCCLKYVYIAHSKTVASSCSIGAPKPVTQLQGILGVMHEMKDAVNGYFGLELFRNVSCVTVHIHIRYHSENSMFRLVVQVLRYSALLRDVFG